MYPNPNYQRPSWEEVTARLDTIGAVAEKLLYLRSVLKKDLQNAEAAPGDLQDVFHSDRTESGWELMEIGYPDRFSREMLEHFEAETKRFRERLQLEIDFLEETRGTEKAPEVRPKIDSELGGPIYWNRDQQAFGTWLYLSYQSFMAHANEAQAEPVDFVQFVETVAPLFHYWKGKTRKAFNPKTLHKNASSYEKGDAEVKGILDESKGAGE